MKAANITSNAKVIRTFFLLAGIAALFAACDVTETDPDVLDSDAAFTTEKVHVLAQGASVIDLNSIVRSSLPVRMAISNDTRLGKLTDLGDGLLRYVPAAGTGRRSDSFGVTVYSESNEIIHTDSVQIIIEHDSTDMPCGLYPVHDAVQLDSREVVRTIDVIANDFLCSHDSASVVLSIYAPHAGFAPYFGTAEVVNNRIVYHPGAAFTNSDVVVYKLSAPDGTTAYGFVSITLAAECNLQLLDDAYTLVFSDSLDSAAAELSRRLLVYMNDTLCATAGAYTKRIVQGPDWGDATIDSTGIVYMPPALTPGQAGSDSLRYELCKGNVCRSAMVRLVIKKAD